ncbi:hydroxyacid dehydrogenase [Ktedonobacter racemifer]|uniref:D-isomer specific 2-hydroxyacid dehydrogenase NAD-binding n=1 Tax=Ktedonobacter racemifer DSM 44963 TaxID=485913 RepID=D6TV71_KTERA|nr:hydroxyacid dehydrogenase [Ktedonobacter racemifer]EFH84171.1 D-isomer specific 2-hydroxyacid dehydrogenase NAD-binding [Ktedonobacter racemifer DSM 44963]
MISADTRPAVAMLVDPQWRQRIFLPASLERLSTAARLIPDTEVALSEERLPELLNGAVACLTGWGTPTLTDVILEQAPSLRLVAHTAGSVHHLVPETIFERGVRVTHAAAALAEGVAEFTVLQILQSLRRLDQFERRLRAGEPWHVLSHTPGHLLSTQTVGLVGASRIGRDVIGLLHPFGCRLLMFDPYLTPEEAREMGVELCELDDLFASSDIVSLHAPLLPSTRGMITSRHLALLRDGGVLVNTARAGLIDEDALVRELVSGRINAALDVFVQEPLPDEHPFRTLPNVLISPHIAAMTCETLLKQGEMMIDEILRFLAGEPLLYEIHSEKLAIMA